MDNWNLDEYHGGEETPWHGPAVIMAEVVPEPVQNEVSSPPPPRQRRLWLPVGLFVATCLSTLLVGGWEYALAVMVILLCHEMGHFVQAWRYGVYASFPYFIPMPFSPFGTFGAVIGMEPRRGDRRALFDIGISGPLAGLVPTLICCVVGLQWSHPEPARQTANSLVVGAPLLFQWLAGWLSAPVPHGYHLAMHPVAFAGWVGLFITSLNLMPIGQLDGGHVLYALLRQRFQGIATLLLMVLVSTVVVLGVRDPRLLNWVPMLLLVIFLIGPAHPPTANDNVPFGPVRIALGWLVLALIPIGFTPYPILHVPF